MAGGKETPRQKMIGMMYLVLTALLALQVSNAVLEKFAIINVTLEEVINESKKKSDETLAKIVENAGKSDNPKILQAKEKAQKVKELTSNTLKAIDDLKVKMMTLSGTDKMDEKLVNDHSSKVASMMIQTQVGKDYQTLLNNFGTELEKITGEKYPIIAKAPKDFEIFREDKDHANKDFLTFTFENTPVIAALASVTEHQSQVLEQEALALEKLAADADAVNIKFDKYILMARSKSSVVAAGSKYEAQMFITGSSSAISPEMYKDGAKLDLVDEGGVKMGKVEFTANISGGVKQKDGTTLKTYKGKAILGDKVIEQDIEYFVIAPVIRVTTGNLPTLYMNCGNKVNIEVPSLGTNYNPSFAMQGGEIVKGEKAGQVTIIPNQRVASVTVSNAGTQIGTEKFDVKPVPRPRIVARDNNGRDIDLKAGIRAGSIAGLRVNVDAESNFKEFCPQDASYRLREASIILASGTTRVAEINATSEIVDLSAWRSLMRPGYQIIIEPKKVSRITFKKDMEPVTVTGQDIIFIQVK